MNRYEIFRSLKHLEENVSQAQKFNTLTNATLSILEMNVAMKTFPK